MTAYAFSMAFQGLFTRALTHNFQHFTSNALARLASTRLDSLLAWRALRHLSAPKLYFIKAHKVTFRRRCPNLPHQHGLSPSRCSFSFYSFLAHSRATYDCGRQHKKFGETKQSWQNTHTQHTHTLTAVAEHYPFAADSGNGYGSCCLVPPALAVASVACCLLPLSCCDACGVRLVLCMRGGFCLCDNRIYCFIKFVFKLPLPAVPHQLPLCLSLCLPFSLSSLSLSRLLCQTMRELFCGFNECPKLAHLIGQFQAVETVKGLSGRLMGLQKSVARFWAPS